MSFVSEFNRLDIAGLLEEARRDTAEGPRRGAPGGRFSLVDFARLISPAQSRHLEALARGSYEITRQRFGKVIRFFAPLYLSNECINNCSYCGFSRDNPILRVTLSLDEARREAEALAAQGFRNLLLVAGEHPRFVTEGYLAQTVSMLRPLFPAISLEVGPLDSPSYRAMTEAGAEGLVVYQETYDRAVYGRVHTAGPKRDFDWRLETPERAYAAGFRRLGVGALFGLADWRLEAISLAAHIQYLLRACWKAQITVSLPRLRPHAGHTEPITRMTERDLVQLLCALRVTFPDIGLVLSTRESPALRDRLIPLGITHLSAGSHTEPGGYTGAGKEKVHLTKKGRLIDVAAPAVLDEGRPTSAAEQFEVADHRSPAEVAARVRQLGFEPVWKDWDEAILGADRLPEEDYESNLAG